MKYFIIRRLLLVIPILFIVAVVAFLITNIIPGDPVRLILGEFATEEDVTRLREQLGYHLPLHERFVDWLGNVIRGDLGESIFFGTPVVDIIISRVEPTFLLALVGQTVGIVVGVPLGIIAAVKHRSWIDQSAIAISLFGISVPNFWAAIMFIMFFGLQLGWFPVAGYSPFLESGLGTFWYLILPGVSVGILQTGLLARMSRSSMLDVLQKDYIRTARSKGLTEKVIVARHAFRNSAIPVVTVLGFSMAILLGGTWVVETIFNIPGTGAIAINSVMRRDLPLIQGSLIFVSFVYVMLNLLVDISYSLLDPRIKYQ